MKPTNRPGDPPEDRRRRANLARYLARSLEGDRARLIEKSGFTKGRIAQLLGNGAFGERAARNLEARLGLPRGWMDAKSPDGQWPFFRTEFARIAALNPQQLAYLEGAIEEALRRLTQAPPRPAARVGAPGAKSSP